MDPEYKLAKLKKIDYECILNTANNFKLSSDISEAKMNKIIKKGKQSKENSKLIEHKKIWNLESIRLNTKKRKIQRKLDALLNSKSDNIFYEFFYLRETISDGHADFKCDVIDPVFTLCDDLKEWKLKKSMGYKVPDPQPIQEIIETMKVKLVEISDNLKRDESLLFQRLETDIYQYGTGININNLYDKVGVGIPMEAWDIECCDSEILSTCLSEFLNVDFYFQTKLDKIREECQFVDASDPPIQWEFDETELFEHLFEVYLMHENINRNQLLQDIIKTVFPNHTKAELVEMEKFVRLKRQLKDKMQALATDWKHDRAELFNKIKAHIFEYNEQIIINQVEEEKLKNQKAICLLLADKVNEWRTKKEELRALEESLLNENAEADMLRAQAQMESETAKREETKRKIYQYKFGKQLQAETLMEEKQRQIELLRANLEKQALIDKERVDYREKLRQEKIQTFNAEKQLKLDQQNLSELRLNQLRDQVRPVIDSDPLRILKPTNAWLNHTDFGDDKTESIFSGLTVISKTENNRYDLPLNTFNERELLANPRLRIENALRDAGLINSEYARSVLKTIPAHIQSRKDCALSEMNFLKQE